MASNAQDTPSLEPSENWDDDFEFQHQSGSGRGKARHQQQSDNTASASTSKPPSEHRKLSVASSAITEDWDLDEGPSNASLPPAAISILQGRSHIVTENWDDDFEDSRNSPAKRRPIPNRIADEEPEESWDEEDDEELNEFGLAKKDEEDKTVTARSRRAALARASEPLPPLPIPPPLLRTPSSPRHPHPFPRTPSSPGAPRPRSRSPTSTASVFSVPNTVSAYSYSSTTHLNSHQRAHRPNSAFALLPPSPPIHKERERRRLRKKSRPRPQGAFELTDVGMSAEGRGRYSFSDNEMEGPSAIGSAYATHMTDIRSRETVSSIDENPEEDSGAICVQPIQTTRIQPAPDSVPATPTKGGAAATMLSRIGSVKKWGVAVRNRRRGSTNPSEFAAQQDNERDQELQRTPRPRSSMSSFNAESSSHSHSRYIPRNFNRHSTTATGTPGSPTTSSSPWFFRASSTGSPTSRGGHMGATGLSRELSTRTTSSTRSGESRSRSRSRPPFAIGERGRDGDGGNGDASSGPGRDVGTPNNKLIKRKSLGFVKLGMGGSSSGGHEGSGSRYPGLGIGRAAEKEKAKEGSEEPRSRRKSFSRFLKERNERERERESSHSPGSPFVVVDTPPKAPPPTPTPTPGSRSFMGSVRRISLVGRHKRSKSGAVLGEVPPSPSAAFFRSPNAGQEPVPPVPYSLPPLPGSASASTSQLSLKLPSSSSALNLPVPAIQKKSTAGRRIVSNSSQNSSVQPPSTASSVSRSSTRQGRTSEDGKRRPSIGGGRRSLDFDIKLFQAGVKQAAKQEEDDEIEDNSKTPSKSAPHPIAPPPPVPLLPPIELHPPSPPNTITPTSALAPSKSDTQTQEKSSRSLAAAFSTSSVCVADTLSPTTSTSSIFFTPTSSPNKSHKTSSNVNKLSPGTRSPTSQQSASLGRSTAGVVAASVGGATTLGVSGGDGLGMGVGVPSTPRRNSLGDLKIPARISQAQVALRRDLGMVREFASNVEQIKDLQVTYNSLVSEVQAILDEHAHRHAQQAYLSAASPPVQPQPRSASPSFLSGLAIRGRGRSNTNPSATPPVISSQRPSIDESSTSSHGQPLPYKELASRFYTINSKYRLSWECAELLIELGGAGGGDGNGNANTKSGAGGNAGEVTSAPATSNTPTPSMQQAQASQNRGKSRERAITLAGDEEKPSSLNTFLSQQYQATSSANPPLASPPSFAQSNSHPSAAWRASTGRHDLSHRQLFLLREMLNNSHAVVSSTSNLGGSNDDEGAAGAGDDSQQSIPEDTIPRRIPLAVQSLQAVHMTANPTNVNVNRDWRWGDARNSTITLPSEEDGNGVQRGGRSRQQEEKEGKRKSGRMGMAGFRDMLKSLRRGSSAAESRPGSASGAAGAGAGAGTSGFFVHSTTSLSTQSSVGSKERGRHRYPHPRLPHPAPPPPQVTQGQSSQGRRRAKTAGDPDSMRSSKTTQATLSTGLGLGKASSSFGAGAGKASPRRPSLASIFRIGGAKNRSGNPPTDNEGSDNAYSPSPPPPPSATTMASPTTDNDADNEGRSEDSSHSHGSGFAGGAGPYGGGGSSTGEEDWDQIDSASDLDAAARAMGFRVGIDGGATVRGASSSKLQKNKKGRSPYLQRDMFDSPPPPPLPVASTSPTSSSGQPLSPHSIVAKGSFNNSQSSLAVYQAHQGSPLASSHIPARTTRLSNVDEHQDDRPPTLTSQHPRTQTRPSSSRSNLAPRFSSNTNSKTASVRSTGPPLNLATTTPLPISAMALPLADPMKLAMTPENIKPLLENAKEVHARLEECIAEVRILLGRGSSQVNTQGAPAVV